MTDVQHPFRRRSDSPNRKAWTLGTVAAAVGAGLALVQAISGVYNQLIDNDHRVDLRVTALEQRCQFNSARIDAGEAQLLRIEERLDEFTTTHESLSKRIARLEERGTW